MGQQFCLYYLTDAVAMTCGNPMEWSPGFWLGTFARILA